MQDDSSQSDPRKIWQDQPSESQTMTLEKIRQKARGLRAKTRRELLGNIAMPLIIFAFSAFGIGIAGTYDPWQRIAFSFAIVWSLTGQYFLNRGMWSAILPGDTALSPGLESYRREIERRRDLSRRVMQWSFGPVVLAIGTLILPIVAMGIRNQGPLRKMIPFITLVVIWVAAIFALRMRAQRELQREIEELNEIEKANRIE